MSGVKCTMMGYKSVNEAYQCRSQMETETGRPYVVRVSSGAAMGGLTMFEVEAIPNCFKGSSEFDDLFGNYDKAKKCQKELERMTGARHVLTQLRPGNFMFSDDYRVTPRTDLAFQGIERAFSRIFNFPLGILSL